MCRWSDDNGAVTASDGWSKGEQEVSQSIANTANSWRMRRYATMGDVCTVVDAAAAAAAAAAGGGRELARYRKAVLRN